MKYYPNNLKVSSGGTQSTIKNIQKFFNKSDTFCYAELGIYKAETANQILINFSNANVHLFDFDDTILSAKNKLSIFENRVTYFENSYKLCDSYNYNLLNIIKENNQPIYDYAFLDGAHTFAIDALSYFLLDILLKPGGYLDFDDYDWTLKNSSLDPSIVKETSLCYTDLQIETMQVKDIVDNLIKRNPNYKEIVKNKIYQKVK